MDIARLITTLLAIAALVAAVIFLVQSDYRDAAVTAILFVGLVIAAGPVSVVTRRVQ